MAKDTYSVYGDLIDGDEFEYIFKDYETAKAKYDAIHGVYYKVLELMTKEKEVIIERELNANAYFA